MQVKYIVSEALKLVGRDDAAEAIITKKGLTDEILRLKRACIAYFNSVVDELARGYFPLVSVEELKVDCGVISIDCLNYKPIEIKHVRVGGEDVEWYILPDELHVDAEKCTVTYAYTPYAMAEEDEFCYPNFAVSERLIEYGIVAEYFLVLGDASSSAAWENKYRNEIENLLSKSKVSGRIPPRRWI